MREPHIAAVERVQDPQPTGTTRRATCSCGWTGPQRGALEMATDDALGHEADARVGTVAEPFVERLPRTQQRDEKLIGLASPTYWRLALGALVLCAGRFVGEREKKTTGVAFGFCDENGVQQPKAQATHVGWTLDEDRKKPRRVNTLTVLGSVGQKRAYLNVDEAEAVRRFLASEDSRHGVDATPWTFTFVDELGAYDVWPEGAGR